jgi:meiotically up-regulated gene 157 (Mug157) protein
MLLVCYTAYIKNAGIHALYINGSVLYPGFELDEAAAYLVALGEYVQWSGDCAILEDERIRAGIEKILEILEGWKDPETGLFKTELDPSDDPVKRPFLTYDNVLVWKGMSYLEQMGFMAKEKPEQLRESITRHLVIEKEGKKLYAWATDGKGGSEIYDDPPGSLVLLKYYGFCDEKDETYNNTVEWIFSAENKYYYSKNGICGTGCVHSPYIWPMSLCNQLLSGAGSDKSEILAMFRQMPMDNGFACETVSEVDGRLKTGGAFATFAGLLGYTLAKIFVETVG